MYIIVLDTLRRGIAVNRTFFAQTIFQAYAWPKGALGISSILSVVTSAKVITTPLIALASINPDKSTNSSKAKTSLKKKVRSIPQQYKKNRLYYLYYKKYKYGSYLPEMVASLKYILYTYLIKISSNPSRNFLNLKITKRSYKL